MSELDCLVQKRPYSPKLRTVRVLPLEFESEYRHHLAVLTARTFLSEMAVWDVRTRHVTVATIPTIQPIRGLAIHGSTGNLLILGPGDIAQHISILEYPPTVIATVRLSSVQPTQSTILSVDMDADDEKPADGPVRSRPHPVSRVSEVLKEDPDEDLELKEAISVSSHNSSDEDFEVLSVVSSKQFWSDTKTISTGITNPSDASHTGFIPCGREDCDAMTFYHYNQPELAAGARLPRQDDLQSVLSVDDDIASRADSHSTPPESREAAANFLVKKFVDDNDLLSMYQEAARQLDEARFVRNHRRLLKSYFIDLQAEMETSAQRITVRFLRLRSERSRISANLYRLIMPLPGQTREKIQMVINQKKDSLFLLDRLLGQSDTHKEIDNEVSDLHALDEMEDDKVIRDDSDNSDESGTDEDDIKLTNLDSVTEFLTTGSPFEAFKRNLQRFLHPEPPSITHPQALDSVVLESNVHTPLDDTPDQDSSSIEEEGQILYPEQNTSPSELVNRLKGDANYSILTYQILLHKRLSWLWRILRPSLKAGYHRIEWTCVSS